MFRNLFIVLFTGYLWDNSLQQLPPAVVWIGEDAQGVCHVTGWLGTVDKLISNDTQNILSFPFYADKYRALAVDVDNTRLYVHDIPPVHVMNFPFPPNNESLFVMIDAAAYIDFIVHLTHIPEPEEFYALKARFTLTYRPEISFEVTGFDIERASRLLYWSDATYRRICVYAMTFKYWMPVITTNLTSPQDVAVNSSSLFWSDIGSDPKIEKSDLVGNNRVILVSKTTLPTLVRPTTLCIDWTYNRLCWLDVGAGYVGCVEFDGSNIVTFRDTNINKATSFTILKDSANYFFFGFKNDSNIRVYNMTNKSSMREITSRSFQDLESVTDMAVLPPWSTPPTGPCTTNNGGCDQICFGSSDMSIATCRCSRINGYQLAADRKSCIIDPRNSEFLVVSDIGDQSISVVKMVSGNKTKVFQATNVKPSVVEFDRNASILYFADINSNTIRKIYLTDPTKSSESVATATSPITSLALDRRNDRPNLYYSFFNFILVKEGSSSTTIWSDKSNVRLSIDSTYGILYFTTFQDGSGATTIFSANLDSPKVANKKATVPYYCTAMAVDFKTSEMFLGDASGNFLILQLANGSYMDFNFPYANFTGLTLDDEYVYLADNNDTCLKKINRKTKDRSCHTITSFSRPFSVVYQVETVPSPTPAPPTTTTTPPDTGCASTIVIIIVVSIGGTMIIIAIIITCGCVVYKLKRKKMLEKSVENEYERNLPPIPVYDAIDGLDMGHFTLTRNGNSRADDHGELTEQMRGTQFGAPDGMSYNTTTYEQNLGSQNFELKRPSMDGSESGITNPRYVKMARSTLTPPDVGIYLQAT